MLLAPTTMNLPQSNHLSSRGLAVLVVFIVCCLLSSFRLVHNSLHASSPDDVARLSDQRFAALRDALPSRGVIGYLGESNDSATPNYYLTQYALAPVIVDRSTNHKLIVGNFLSTRPPRLPSALQVVKDFGNGVVLLINKDVH